MTDSPTEPRTGPGFETARLFASVNAELFGEAPPELTLGRYRVVDVLGSGGMGVVYRAYEPELDRVVALKIIRPRMDADKNAKYLARFVREGRMMAKLGHPNILTVYEAGTQDGVGYLAMEFVSGGTLAEWAREHPRGDAGRFEALLGFAMAAGEGLVEAHAAKVVHRDIKPENMLLDASGRLKLADFGIARVADGERVEPVVATRSELRTHDDTTITQTDEVVGTLRYAAPEQLSGLATEASDQFSFCLTFFELALGRYPFPTSVPIGFEPGDTLPEADGVPRWFQRVMARGLSADPERRFATMRALLDALDRGRRPSRGPTVFVAGLGAAALVAGFAWAGREPDPCSGLDEVAWWSPARADELRHAFSATGESSALANATATVESVDAYVEAWTTARTDACEARTRRGVDTTATDGCLVRREEQVGALLERLVGADATVVSRAPDAMWTLPSVASCLDTERLLALRFDPPSPSQEAAVAEARLAVSQSVATRELGLLSEAVSESERAVERAEASAYEPAIAEALVELAEAHYERSDAESAAVAARRALVHARASAHAEAAARAAAVLAWAQADTPAEVEFWSDLALSEARVVSVPVFEAQVLAVQAGKLMSMGRIEAALEIHESLLEKAQGPRGVATASTNAASAYLRAGNMERGGALARRAAQLFSEVLGPDHPSTLTAELNVANALWGQGELGDAERTFRRVVEGRSRLAGDDADTTQNARYNLAMVLAERGSFASARTEMQRVRAHYASGSLKRAMTELELAGIEAAAGNGDESVRQAAVGLRALEAATDSRVMLGQGFLAAAKIRQQSGTDATDWLARAESFADAFDRSDPWHDELAAARAAATQRNR